MYLRDIALAIKLIGEGYNLLYRLTGLLVDTHPVSKTNNNLLKMYILVNSPLRTEHADHIARNISKPTDVSKNSADYTTSAYRTASRIARE